MNQRRVAIIGLDFLLGLVFVLFNFDGFVRYSAGRWVDNPTLSNGIISMSRWPARAMPISGPQSYSLLHDLLILCFYGIWIYLGLVIILALIRRDFRVAANGVAGTTAGFFGFSLLAWIGVILVVIGGLIAAIIPFLQLIWSYISRFFGVIFDFIVGIFSWIWGFIGPVIIFLLPYVLLLIAVAVVAWLVVQLYRGYGLKAILALALVGVVAYLGRSILMPILTWALKFIGIIFAFLGKVLAWLLANFIPIAMICILVGSILTLIGSLGAMVVDQVRSAWHSGTGHRGILLGSFSIGLAVALIVWAATATPPAAAAVDAAWQEAVPVLGNIQLTQVMNFTLPGAVEEATRDLLAYSGAPNFDAALLVIVLLTAYIGIARGIMKNSADEFQVTFFHQDVLVVGGALALVVPAVMLMVVGALLPRDD